MCMSANGISHLKNKRQRQEAKLKLAQEKRESQGQRSNLKKGQLPSLYGVGGKNDAADRLLLQDGNTELTPGRPWK